jgi:branched-chain amino acid aminotransferase
MKSTKYIWMDGKFKKWKDAKIHLISHTLHYSAGAFEGIRLYKTSKGSAVFRLKEHVKRFFYSSGAVGIEIPYSQKEICDVIIKLLKKNGRWVLNRQEPL